MIFFFGRIIYDHCLNTYSNTPQIQHDLKNLFARINPIFSNDAFFLVFPITWKQKDKYSSCQQEDNK